MRRPPPVRSRPPAAPAQLPPGPSPPALPGRWDLPPGQGDLASEPRRPPASLWSEQACEEVRRPPLLLSSLALSSSALPSPPLRSPLRGSSPSAARCPELAARAPGCPARTGSAGLGAAAAAGAAGRCRTSGPRERKRVRRDSRGARAAGWLGEGHFGARRSAC